MATPIPRDGRDPSVPDPAVPDPVVEACKRDLDPTLIRENLRRSPEKRILQLMELQRLAEEVRRAGREQADRR